MGCFSRDQNDRGSLPLSDTWQNVETPATLLATAESHILGPFDWITDKGFTRVVEMAKIVFYGIVYPRAVVAVQLGLWE